MIYHIRFGTNINHKKNCEQAKSLLVRLFGEESVETSPPLYSRDYNARPDDPTASVYLNFTAIVSTGLAKKELNQQLKALEREMGRTLERKKQGIIDADFDVMRLHYLPYTGAMPERFTYPFCYQPHPAAEVAAGIVKEYIAGEKEWEEELRRGKMFGVLVVERLSREKGGNGKFGFLAAYSGLLAGRNDHDFFVPPVFDSQQREGHFKTEERRISALSRAGRETRQYSLNLQRWLFAQYNIMNACGEERNLIDIFNEHYAGLKGQRPVGADLVSARGQRPAPPQRETVLLPPSGAGDCCAPKLLQYAYLNGLRPLCMAEFWWGESPKGEIRRHGQYYPACTGKCKPILRHMLKGLEVERNPHETAVQGELEIVFEDDFLVVVNKPAGMLSVPGNIDAPDVVTSLQNISLPSPQGEGLEVRLLLPVHRLDMATSGLLMLAKGEEVYKTMQAIFLKKEVRKEYMAVVEKAMAVGEKGRITLPLARDLEHRPCQKVDYEKGKACLTEYEVIQEPLYPTFPSAGFSNRLLLRPLTGRTHQLRVHCAHPDGLDNPIVGDELYGKSGKRLLLHSQRLEFTHPFTKKEIKLYKEPNF